MKSIFSLLMSTATVAVFLGCSADISSNSGTETNTATYSYSYTVNGCKTGEHSFASASDYCNGLMNETLNNYCAHNLRESAYNQNCK